MSYQINRTDGELLLDLTDGVIDTSATDLTLIGKNYKGFGEWINENFVHLLENFASTQQPSNPLTGQLWYDKQDQRLKIFNGTIFRSATGTIVNSSQPTNLVAGDIWIDNENNRLYLFDGTDLTLVGPTYDAGQGRTGFESDTQLDINNIKHTIMKMYIGGVLVGILSTEEFIIPYDYIIPGLDPDPEDTASPKRQILKRGFNIVDRDSESGLDGFWWRGTAQTSKSLLADDGTLRFAANFLPTNDDGVTTGSLSIKNSQGISVGIGDRTYMQTKIFGTSTIVDNLEVDANYVIRIKNNQFQNSLIKAFEIDTSEYKNTMYSDLPIIYEPATDSYDFSLLNFRPRLEVWGDGFYAGDVTMHGTVAVKGDLQVGGETIYMNTQNLYVEDKNIELAISTTLIPNNDVYVDAGGIILRSSDGDKQIQWYVADYAWRMNQNLDLVTGPSVAAPQYRINGTPVLSQTALLPSVTSATGLTTIGTLENITIDNVTIDGNKLSVINNVVGLAVDSNGPLSVENNRIENVADPVNEQDAVNKSYLSTALSSQGVIIAFDMNGLVVGSDPNTAPYNAGTIENIRLVAHQMRAADTVLPGTELRVLASWTKEINAIVPVTVGYGNDTTLQISKVTVRDSANTGTVAVVQDIVGNQTSNSNATVTFNIERYKYTFTSDGNNWTNPVVEQIVI